MPDAAVERIIAHGFSADVAKWALRDCGNDVTAAIRHLRAVSALL